MVGPVTIDGGKPLFESKVEIIQRFAGAGSRDDWFSVSLIIVFQYAQEWFSIFFANNNDVVRDSAGRQHCSVFERMT